MNEEKEPEPLFTEPETEPQKPKTRTELFTDLLNACPDIETAKSRIKEFADQLGVKKSLGYKAMRKTRFVLEQPETPRPEVPTVKINEAERTQIEQEIEALEPTAKPEAILGEPRPLEAEAISPPTPQPTETIAKIEPIFQRSMQRLLNNGLEMVGGGKDVLDSQESKDTATLMPILIYRLTKVTMTEDQFIDVTLVTHFGSIVVKVANKRMQRGKTERKEEKAKPPTPETPTPRDIKQPPTEAELNEMKQKEKPPFLQRL